MALKLLYISINRFIDVDILLKIIQKGLNYEIVNPAHGLLIAFFLVWGTNLTHKSFPIVIIRRSSGVTGASRTPQTEILGMRRIAETRLVPTAWR